MEVISGKLDDVLEFVTRVINREYKDKFDSFECHCGFDRITDSWWCTPVAILNGERYSFGFSVSDQPNEKEFSSNDFLPKIFEAFDRWKIKA